MFDKIKRYFAKVTAKKQAPKTETQKTQVERERWTAVKWRESLREAENVYNPQRVLMQKLFNDVILDGYVKSAISKRKNLTLLKDFEFLNPDGSENEEIEKFFDKIWFKKLINYILDAEAFGYSVIKFTEVTNEGASDVEIIRRAFFETESEIIKSFLYSSSGISINDESLKDWIIYVKTDSEDGNSKCGYGYLYSVALYFIYLRNNYGYNADYVEKFITPFIIAKSHKTEEDERNDYLFESLKNLASSSVAIVDPTDEIEFLESKNTSSGYQVFADWELRNIKAIYKIILGHADAMDSTAGKLGNNNEVQNALNEIESLDCAKVENVINNQVLPKLRNLGVIIPNVYFKFSNDKEEVKEKENEIAHQKSVAEMLKTLTEAGYKIDSKTASELLEIEIKDAPATEIQNTLNRFYKV